MRGKFSVDEDSVIDGKRRRYGVAVFDYEADDESLVKMTPYSATLVDAESGYTYDVHVQTDVFLSAPFYLDEDAVAGDNDDLEAVVLRWDKVTRPLATSDTETADAKAIQMPAYNVSALETTLRLNLGVPSVHFRDLKQSTVGFMAEGAEKSAIQARKRIKLAKRTLFGGQ